MLDDKELEAKLDLKQVVSKVKSPMHKYTAHNMKYFKDVVELRREMRKNQMIINVEKEDKIDFEHLPGLNNSNSVKVLSCNLQSSRSKSDIHLVPT